MEEEEKGSAFGERYVKLKVDFAISLAPSCLRWLGSSLKDLLFPFRELKKGKSERERESKQRERKRRRALGDLAKQQAHSSSSLRNIIHPFA